MDRCSCLGNCLAVRYLGANAVGLLAPCDSHFESCNDLMRGQRTWKSAFMHQAGWRSSVFSLALAVLGLIYFFAMTPDNLDIGFWIAIMAYVTLALSTTVKT